MNLPNHEVVVLDIAGFKARLMVMDNRNLPALLELGFESQGDQYVRQVADDEDRKRLIRDLIRLDAIFSEGPGWSPSQLVAYLEQQGESFASYRSISWSNPEMYTIRQSIKRAGD